MLRGTLLNQHGNCVRTGAPVLQYLKATEYYVDRDGSVLSCSKWIGHGSANLGLAGEVSIEHMEHLARGRGPQSQPLRENAGSSVRVGYDFTWSSVKSASVAYAIADPSAKDEIRGAHEKAVEKGFAYLESLARVRTGKGGRGPELEATGLVASAHTHFGSRSLDCQIHTHTLVYNNATGIDGKSRALHADHMNMAIRTAGALYRAEHAWQLKEQGFSILKDRQLDADGRETGDVFFKIAGISDELNAKFSKRREEILAHQKEHGGSMDQASLATRKHKDEPTYKELTAMWDAALDQERKEGHVPSIYELRSHAIVQEMEPVTDEDVLRRLHTNSATFTKAQLIERLAMEHVGQKSCDEILKEADHFLERAAVVELDKGHGVKLPTGEHEYCAQWMLDMERELTDRGVARLGDEQSKVPRSTVTKAIEQVEKKNGFAFSDEQREAIYHQTSETGGTAIITGRAGTGKTTVSEAAVAAWRADGRNVIGVSTGWDPAKKLESEAKIESLSAAKFLHELDGGRRKLKSNDVVVFDEAAMAGTEVIVAIQRHTDRAQAKLVLMGDSQQLQPIAAGNPFKLLAKEIGTSELTEIRRQAKSEDRQTANMLYGRDSIGRGGRVIDELDKNGQIERFASTKEAAGKTADAYLESPTPLSDKLIIAGTRNDVRMVNKTVREKRQVLGEVGQQNAKFTAKAGGKLDELEVSVGDQVRFSERNDGLQVYNGLMGEVQNIGPGKEKGSHKITVKTQSEIKRWDGRTVEFDTSDFRSISLGYASTVHKSQGQGKKEVYHLVSTPGMVDRHMQLVAFTRTKERYRMFGETGDIEAMRSRVGLDRYKVNAVEQVKKPTLNIEAGDKLGMALKARRERKQGAGIEISR